MQVVRDPRRTPARVSRVILEQAQLPVRPGEEAEFETAFATAGPIIMAAPGCRAVRLLRCVERPGSYLLLVEWETIEDHTEGFRASAAYQEWRRLLHRYYDPFPVVEHFAPVVVV